MSLNTEVLQANNLFKTFTLHLQGGTKLEVLRGAHLTARAGKCIALTGPSGAGKSTLLRALYGNYLVDAGEILIRHHDSWCDLVMAPTETILGIRKTTLGYVSQFLRVIPRVSARDIVAAAAMERGVDPEHAQDAATNILNRLGIPPRLQSLPPATFSGGEQQRVNLARAFICPWPILLLDEPTASLDAANRDIVIELINEAKGKGSAVIGIFHDEYVRDALADEVKGI